jgi:hypothetical protein
MATHPRMHYIWPKALITMKFTVNMHLIWEKWKIKILIPCNTEVCDLIYDCHNFFCVGFHQIIPNCGWSHIMDFRTREVWPVLIHFPLSPFHSAKKNPIFRPSWEVAVPTLQAWYIWSKDTLMNLSYTLHVADSKQMSGFLLNGRQENLLIPFLFYVPIYVYPARCNFTQFIYIWKLLYMLWVVPPPIIRSAYKCICSSWWLVDRAF